MKKSFKILAAALAAITAMSCTSATAFADKLKTVDGITYRYSDSGELKGTYTGWRNTSKGKFYYKNGVKLKNKWLKINGKRAYYLLENGSAARGTMVINGRVYSFTGGGNDAGKLISSNTDELDVTMKAKKVTASGLTLQITLVGDRFEKQSERVVIPHSYQLAKKTESGWELLDPIKIKGDIDIDDEAKVGTSEREIKLGKNGLDAGKYMLVAEVEIFNKKKCTLTDVRMCHVTFTIK
ncbi:MAG: hypothetical protein IK990_00225 [Ruminiclostridium sp.]|nr:hypothetical protein [Ruminiclostridium sp.]